MRERPILFSAPMVRAILEGRKTQTRRIVKPQQPRATQPLDAPYEFELTERNGDVMLYTLEQFVASKCPYGAPGDRLWVRETHAFGPIVEDPDDWRDNPDDWETFYRADGDERDWQNHDGEPVRAPWRPSIFMPRWASRITLEVTGVRVERLRDITPEDVESEGIGEEDTNCDGECGATPCSLLVGRFERLWRDINGAESWDANPYVWVISFRRLTDAVA